METKKESKEQSDVCMKMRKELQNHSRFILRYHFGRRGPVGRHHKLSFGASSPISISHVVQSPLARLAPDPKCYFVNTRDANTRQTKNIADLLAIVSLQKKAGKRRGESQKVQRRKGEKVKKAAKALAKQQRDVGPNAGKEATIAQNGENGENGSE